jgi:PDZ domain-containing secreted protein
MPSGLFSSVKFSPQPKVNAKPAFRLVNVQVKTRRKLGWSLFLITPLVFYWALSVEMPFVVETPGPVNNILGEADGKPILQIDSAAGENPGSIDSLSVSVYGSHKNKPSLGFVLAAFFSKDKAIYPMDIVYPPSVTDEQDRIEGKKLFDESEVNAIAAVSVTNQVQFNQHWRAIWRPSLGIGYLRKTDG